MSDLTYRCCIHCADDPVHDVGIDQHTLDCTTCNAERVRAGVLAEVERTIGMYGFRFSSREDHAEALAIVRAISRRSA
jgi:hypothetical protein